MSDYPYTSRRYEQPFTLNSGKSSSSYLSHPYESYSSSARSFLDSQPLGDSSRFNRTYEDLTRDSDLLGDRGRERTRGIPDNNRFGNITDYGSAPSRLTYDKYDEPFTSTRDDPYRSAIFEAKTYTGGSLRDEYLSSPFKRREEEYHALRDLDPLKAAYAERYREGEASQLSRRERSQSPGLYVGVPKLTRDWHHTSYDEAFDIESGLRDERRLRKNMASDYPGYDEYDSSRGHRERVKSLDTEIGAWTKASRSHWNAWHTP